MSAIRTGGRILLALLAVTLASPAMAQVQHDAAHCWVEMRTVEAPDVAIVTAVDIEGHQALLVSGKDWPFEPDTAYRIRVHILPLPASTATPQDKLVDGTGFRDPAGRSGIKLPPHAGLFGGSRMALYREDGSDPFAVIDVSYDPPPLRACLVRIAADDRGSGKPQGADSGPKMKGTFLTNDDYPPAAIRAGEQGITAYRVTVSAHGVPSACTLTLSSGSQLLDDASCGLILRRGRFVPARDADGAATQGTAEYRLNWMLPAD